jgi:uncharacterized repeat protein (TIGR01451 family)
MKFFKHLASIDLIKTIGRWLNSRSLYSISNEPRPSLKSRRIGFFRRNNLRAIGQSFDSHQQSKSKEICQDWKWIRRISASIAALIFALIPSIAYANITITPSPSNPTILSSLLGPNVALSNLVISQGTTGKSIATFTGGLTGGTPNIGINAGVALVTGDASTAIGPNNIGSRSTSNAGSSIDSDLLAIDPNTNQFDTTSISVDVIPAGNFMSVKFVFASEEYDEYVCSQYNDAMGIFVTGPGIVSNTTTGKANIARVSNGTGNFFPISINQINKGVAGSNGSSTYPNCTLLTNSAFYTSNPANGANLQYDGMTIPIEAVVAVTPQQKYTVKIAVADISDTSLDSAVFVEKISSYNLDLGDAPNTYGTAIPNSSVLLPGPARHSTGTNVYLGSIAPDGENNTIPATAGAIANNDDITGTDDEDAFSANDLLIVSGVSSYNIPTIPVHNGLGTTAKLMGWIDFNKSGVFGDAAGEMATANVPAGATTAALNWSGFTPPTIGTSYARFRITTDASLVANPSPLGLAFDGEVEDYRVKFDTRANIGAKLLLVKRITGIQPTGSTTWYRTTNPNETGATATVLNTVVHNPLDTANNDTNATWPSNYLVGAYNAGKVKAGDSLEYTIYYLNAQGANASNVKICDPIRGKQAYVAGSMQLQPGSSNAPIILTDGVDLTVDRANSYAAGNVPTNCNAANTTATGIDRGGVEIGITGTGSSVQPDLTLLTGATSSGTPPTSYGWFRFRTKVDP